ncbi:glycosyltransferase family 4 protein [Shinella fusca]|uniref:UDP-glucose:(Heptosyl)LPS alpha-1,3-glucosyltransferase n=1 Tax=Shinella fusca TaxID=544480 RepID=A0A7W8DT71_9HYPH|nr:glycosyltransferase family 4 protein [Shinella fusca]MBB5041388.1 UDP-glucose:(heptosyl)LPS alpha-1,3-glucosyltransferase [Shinella fusca]
MFPEILQVIQEFGAIGGADRVAWELAQAFNRVGLINGVVTSAALDASGTATDVILVSPWVKWFSTRGGMRHLARLLVFPAFTLAATRVVRRRRKALVISHGDCLAGDVVVVHAVNAENLKIKKAAGQWRWLLNPIHAWVALRDYWMIGHLRYKRYIAVSRRVSQELVKHYRVPESRIRVISNGVDVDRFKPDASARRRIREDFGIPQDAPLLLFVGHEFNRKGLAYLIDAMERLGPEFHLLVVGSDNQAPYRAMAKASAGRIVYAGEQKNVERFFAAADAFVFPTSYETFSLVCMEAMASGLTVFATSVGGIEEYLKDGQNGMMIVQDGADIARKIEAVFRDAALAEQMRAAARLTAENYSWDNIARQYVDLLAEILEERKAEHPLAPARLPAH